MRATLRLSTVGAATLSIFAIIVCDNVFVSFLCGLSLFTLGTLWEMTK